MISLAGTARPVQFYLEDKLKIFINHINFLLPGVLTAHPRVTLGQIIPSTTAEEDEYNDYMCIPCTMYYLRNRNVPKHHPPKLASGSFEYS